MAVTDEQILAFVESADWRFAATMATNEHWYVLERDCGGAVFDALAAWQLGTRLDGRPIRGPSTSCRRR